MKNKPALVLYIILNIIISAATMLFVMWLWDRANPRPTGVIDNDLPYASSQQALIASATENTDLAEPTGDFITDDFEVDILAIVAPGNLDLEYVEIRNQSEGSVDISGWQLRDDNANIFTFPTLILNQNGAIKILSKNGINTAKELYWQSDAPIWESGEKARLLDNNGNNVATYSIP